MASGRLFIPGWMPARDSNGDPIPNVVVSFYQNETDVLASVYADDALTVPLTNPVAANSSGRFPQIYASDAMTYSASVDAPYGPAGQPFTFDGLQASQAADIAAANLAQGAADDAEAALAATEEAIEAATQAGGGSAAVAGALAGATAGTEAGTEAAQAVLILKTDTDAENVPAANRPAFRQNIGARFNAFTLYGGIADGTSHPVSEWIGVGERYASLAALQVDYPHVIATSDEIDWAAAQKVCSTLNQLVIPEGDAVMNRKLTVTNKAFGLCGSGKDASSITWTNVDPTRIGFTFSQNSRVFRSGVQGLSLYVLGVGVGTCLDFDYSSTNGNHEMVALVDVRFGAKGFNGGDPDPSQENYFFSVGARFNNVRTPRISGVDMAGRFQNAECTMFKLEGITTDIKASDTSAVQITRMIDFSGSGEGLQLQGLTAVFCEWFCRATFADGEPYIAVSNVNTNCVRGAYDLTNVRQFISGGGNLNYACPLGAMPGYEGIRIAGAFAQEFIISNMYFQGSGYTGSKVGIHVVSGTQMLITDNIIKDFDTGVLLDSGTSNIHTHLNEFSGNTTNYTDLGTGNSFFGRRTGQNYELIGQSPRISMLGGDSAGLKMTDAGATAGSQSFDWLVDGAHMYGRALNDDGTQKQILIDLFAGLVALGGAAGAESLRANFVANAVNRINASGAATGNKVSLQAAGADANIGMFFGAKGTGLVEFVSGLMFNSLASIVNAADDTAAAAAGVVVGGIYRTGSAMKVRAA